MKECLSFGERLKKILTSRELSVLEASRVLGMKSATSLSRIIHDEVNIKTLERIYPGIAEALSLTCQEKAQLKRGLMICRMGIEQYLGYRSMWQLIFPAKTQEEETNTLLHAAGHMTMPPPEKLDQLIGYLLDCSQMEIIMVGCCARRIIDHFYPLAEMGKNIRMIHFLPGEKKLVQRMISNIAAITPFLPYGWYSAYLPEDNAASEVSALYERNEILIDSTDQHGNRRRFHLVQVEAMGMQMMEYADEMSFQFHRQLLLRNRSCLTPVKMAFSHLKSSEDYIIYTEYYRQTEENKAIYSIKPDLPINFIHPDLLVAAVTEGFTEHAFVSRNGLEEVVARLYQIQLQRWKNIFEKKKVTHIVFSAKVMLEFARTGIQTDHFFAIRAFTPLERRKILQHIRRQMAENPYFNVYFSMDDNLPFHFEITAYEQFGVQLTYNHTGYDFTAGHSEALITHNEFLKIFITFYQSKLLQGHVLSHRENLAMMDQIIAAIPEKKV